MRSVFSSSPPGAPRSMVRALSMPRPAYMAAQSPAGPPPTMITSYELRFSVIRHPFLRTGTKLQSRRVALTTQRALQPAPKRHRFELDVRLLRAGELLKRAGAHRHDPVAVPPPPVQQRGGRLDQPLKDPGFVLLNYRTPDGFQGFVREPVLVRVEEVPGGLEVAAAIIGRHQPPPRCSAGSRPHDSSRSSPPGRQPRRAAPRPTRRSSPPPAPRLPRTCPPRTRDAGTQTAPGRTTAGRPAPGA